MVTKLEGIFVSHMHMAAVLAAAAAQPSALSGVLPADLLTCCCCCCRLHRVVCGQLQGTAATHRTRGAGRLAARF
jgi:hypothetical protein